jgi:lysyl-tRNA synthetase class 2
MSSRGTERQRLAPRIPHLRTRAAVLRALREFFDARGYLEVETPLRVRSPGLELHLSAIPAGDRWLNTSPEYQMKRLLVGGLERIYQMGRAFRDDERGGQHVSEFSLLEWYRAGAALVDLMAETEELVAHVARAVRGHTTLTGVDGNPVDVSPGWERLSVAEALRRYAGVEATGQEDGATLNARARAAGWRIPDAVAGWDEVFARLLVDAVEPHLGRGRPTLLWGYPARCAALARLDPEDTNVAQRFELYAGGLELANAFAELADPKEQRRRFEQDRAERRRLGRPAHPLDERFLAALEEGLPDASGIALGVDRLVMLVAGVSRIDDVLAFTPEEL